MAMMLGTFQAYGRRHRTDGVRVLVTRRWPRGLKKRDSDRYFDAWLPLLAPSDKLLKWYQGGDKTPERWRGFTRRYVREMTSPQCREGIKLLARLARRTPLSIGCNCPTDEGCHRSILRKLIERVRR